MSAVEVAKAEIWQLQDKIYAKMTPETLVKVTFTCSCPEFLIWPMDKVHAAFLLEDWGALKGKSGKGRHDN